MTGEMTGSEVRSANTGDVDHTRKRAHRNAMFLVRGGAVTFMGSIGAFALGFLFNLLVARQIGADQYGLYVLGLMVVTIASTFSALGLARGSQRFIALYLTDDDQSRLRGTIVLALVLIYGAGFLTAGALVVTAPWIAERFFGDQRLTWVIRVLSISVPFLAALDTLGKMTQGFRIMRYKVYFEDLFQNGLRVVIGIALLTVGWQLNAVLLAQIIPAVLATLLLMVALHRVYPFARSQTAITFEPRSLLRFSVPLHASTVTRFMQGRTELLVLGALGTSEAAGIYNISLRVSFIGAMLINAFIAIASPMITSLHRKGDIDQMESVFKLITKWLLVVNIPLTLMIVLLANPLLEVFGREFTAGAMALAILALARMVDSATGICGAMINMVGRSGISAINAAVSLVASLLLATLLIPPFGLIGAAVAAFLALLLVNIIRIVQIYRWFKIHPASVEMWKPVAAGLVSLGAALVVRQIWPLETVISELLVVSSVICGTYLIALLALGLDETDAEITRAVRSKLRAFRWNRAREA